MTQALDRIGKLGEECPSVPGFVIFGSFGVSIGAGFGSLLKGLCRRFW
jgi:hypothetical protein